MDLKTTVLVDTLRFPECPRWHEGTLWCSDFFARRAMQVPTLIVIGDAVEMFGLLGGGKVDGDMGGRPTSQLAVLPATTHFAMLARLDLLLPIMASFLDAPLSVAE